MNTDRSLWQKQLSAGLQRMAITLSEQQQCLLVDFLSLLTKWNQAYNLTAIRDVNEMVSRQLLDSLSIVHLLEGRRILDVGTGPGLPGIPLAVARPECQFTLIDSNGKKTRFVQQAITTLGLKNVVVLQTRVEVYQTTDKFDTITSRAFAALPRIVQLTQHLLAENGQLLAMKGTIPRDEMAELEVSGYQIVVDPLMVPDSDGERHALRVRSAT